MKRLWELFGPRKTARDEAQPLASMGIEFTPPPTLEERLAELPQCADPVDRHFHMQNIVKETYAKRSDPEMRRLCIETGMAHLNEFPSMAPALRAEFQENLGGNLPRVPCFAWLATALAEDGRVDEAVRVCRTAADLSLADGTKGGYLGRAERLAKRSSR